MSLLEGFSVSFRIQEGNSKKAWKPKRKKKWEEFKSTQRILYYIQNSKRNSNLAPAEKEEKRKKKPKKWVSTVQDKKKRKERKPKKK